MDTIEQVEELIRQIDKSKNMRLDFDEFLYFISKSDQSHMGNLREFFIQVSKNEIGMKEQQPFVQFVQE